MKRLTQKVLAIFIVLNLSFGFHKLKAQSNIEDTYNQEVKNLSAFAKSYGYIRFFTLIHKQKILIGMLF